MVSLMNIDKGGGGGKGDQGRFSLFVVSDRKNARYEEFFRTEKILFLDEGIAF